MILLTGSIATSALAQTAPHEYRSEVVLYGPEIAGLSPYAVLEDHLDAGGLATTERQRGAGVSVGLDGVKVETDFRYINGWRAELEHRWSTALLKHWRLPARIDFTDRTKLEFRDVRKLSLGAQWSTRLQERLIFARALPKVPIAPFVAVQPSYDTRYHTVNRWEEHAGVKIARGTISTQLYGEWWEDTRSDPKRYAAFGVLVKVGE